MYGAPVLRQRLGSSFLAGRVGPVGPPPVPFQPPIGAAPAAPMPWARASEAAECLFKTLFLFGVLLDGFLDASGALGALPRLCQDDTYAAL